MLISHSHKFVFVHNPKVAGTTLRTYLQSTIEGGDRLRAPGILDYDVVERTHLRPDQWTNEIWQAYRDGYYFFGMVRDPLDRFMSAMSEFKFQHEDLLDRTGLSLEALLQGFLTHSSIAHDWRFNHFSEQWRYFILDRGLRLDIDILRFENLSEDFGPLMERLGLSAANLENFRPSYFRPPSISEETQALVRYLYRRDFTEFSYRIDEPQTFCNYTHAHRAEAVHRFPLLARDHEQELNRREIAALHRAQTPAESMTHQLFDAVARCHHQARMDRTIED